MLPPFSLVRSFNFPSLCVIHRVKEDILRLRSEGKTYDEITEIIGCSKSSVSYHCNPGVRSGYINRQRIKRRNLKVLLVEYKGGRCEICGYAKCIAALEFHHTDPRLKDPSFKKDGFTSRRITLDALKKEIDKCILLCSNCHREVHFDMKNAIYRF